MINGELKNTGIDKDKVLSLKIGDSFIFPDSYTNSKMNFVRHNYKCTILAVIIDDSARQGFTIKRYLKTKKRYVYEFFDIWKVLYRCHIK